jgi:two-component system, OmpR family, response regulator ResD
MVKILIVEDEKDVRLSFRKYLEKENYQVEEASNGKDALLLLEKEKFDVVVLDILMPGMTGVEVAERIRANPKLKGQKIIFASVVALGEKGNEIKKINPAAYITKPFKLEELKAAIMKALKAK